MSKLKEYLELVKKGTPNIDKIANSVLNQVKSKLGHLPLDQQEEITKRKLICRDCPFYSLNLMQDDSEYKKLYGKPFTQERLGRYCGICGCPENTRTHSLDSNCGLEEYNEEHPDNKQELKWKEYKTK